MQTGHLHNAQCAFVYIKHILMSSDIKAKPFLDSAMKSDMLCIFWAIFNIARTPWRAITKKPHAFIFHWDVLIMLNYSSAKFQLVLSLKEEYIGYFRAPWRVLAILCYIESLFHMWAFIVRYNSSEHCLAQPLSFHGVWIGLLMQWIRTVIEKMSFLLPQHQVESRFYMRDIKGQRRSPNCCSCTQLFFSFFASVAAMLIS